MSDRRVGLVVAAVAALGIFIILAIFRPGGPTPGGDSRSRALSKGNFEAIAEPATGQATIYRLPGGKWVLRFEKNFKIQDGSGAKVYLSAAPSADGYRTIPVGGLLHLGSLKSETGTQEYGVPTDLDLERFRTVILGPEGSGDNLAVAKLVSLGQPKPGE